MRIVDAHTHPEFNTPWEDPHLLSLSSMNMEEVVRQSGTIGIHRMVVLGNIVKFGFGPNPEQVREINEGTERLIQQFPDFFIGYCYMNPLNPEEDLKAEADRFLRNGDFVAIKLECDCSASDARMGPLMEIAEELNVPVLQHAWDSRNRGNTKKRPPRKEETDGNDVAVLASRHPRVRIQMAHLTGVNLPGIDAIAPYDNVWADTSGAQPFSNVTEYAVNRLGSDRVIYGSDFPIRDIAGSLSKVLSGPFSGKEKEKLLSGNFFSMMGRAF